MRRTARSFDDVRWLVSCLVLLLVYAAAAFAAPEFPVKHSADQRYLVDQNAAPFPILGRTAWFVLSVPVVDYQAFVDDTAARGYNAIELHVINHDPRGNNPPFNGRGDLPFLKRLNGTRWTGTLNYADINAEAPDFTTPTESYWRFVDEFLAYCESKGILVFMFPAYVGFQGSEQGWMQEMVANGPAKMRAYGAWIAARYKSQRNLVWMMGGDMGTPPDTFSTAQTEVEAALLTGLASVTGQQSTLFSAEWTSESIATDQPTFGRAMTLNGVYSWSGDVSTHGRRAYAHHPVMPAFLLEEPYDEEGPDGNGINESATQPVRRFQWWGWLSTIGGYISGNGYVWPFRSATWFKWRGWLRAVRGYVSGKDHVWPFRSAWSSHLNTQGSRDMSHLNAFVRSIAWYKLVPSGLSGMRTLITDGGSSVGAVDYVAAAATPEGTLLVAYIPPAHYGSVTVDMTALSGPVRARWWDPTSGGYSDIGTGLANIGTRPFKPPGNNAAGARDWVLVLDASASQLPTGIGAPSGRHARDAVGSR